MIKHLALVGENLLKQMCITLIVLLVLYPSGSWAQKWVEPKKGTDTRKALMDAIRPHIEWHLGKPIQFVVEDLRVSGNVGFGTLSPQRPGGAKIDLMNNLDPENELITKLAKQIYHRLDHSTTHVE